MLEIKSIVTDTNVFGGLSSGLDKAEETSSELEDISTELLKFKDKQKRLKDRREYPRILLQSQRV